MQVRVNDTWGHIAQDIATFINSVMQILVSMHYYYLREVLTLESNTVHNFISIVLV